MATAPWPQSHFWDYSIALYGSPGVAECCLELQDRYGADVNLLLLAVWLGARGARLDRAGWAELERRTRSWQDEVVGRMRAVRRELRAMLDHGRVDPWRRERLLALKQGLAALELDSERLEQHELEALAPGLATPAAPGAATARANLADYLARAGFHPGTVATLLRAAFPEDPNLPEAGPSVP